MKLHRFSRYIFLIPLFLLSFWAEADEKTPLEEWKAKSGHTVVARLVKLEGTQVTVEKADQTSLALDIDQFIQDDIDRILTHFGMKGKLLLAEGSNVELLNECVFPLGEIHGPVQAGESSYHVYVPKSLRKDRLAPILFYTNAAGGDTTIHVKKLKSTAELFGCVIAYSIESCNDEGWEKNMDHAKRCMKDLFDKLPIDKGRVHYTGNSGGGNAACLNSSVNKAWGIMPNVAMLPEGYGVNTKVIYATGGSTDHNRFLTAHAADMYGDNGFHRMSKNGHGDAPVDHRCDGLFWMTCKYFAKYKNDHLEERKDFERDMLNWLDGLKKKSPQRAYSNAIILRDIYPITGINSRALDQLLEQLASDEDNLRYREGLLALNEFSKKHLAPIGKRGWTAKGHAGVEGVSDAEILKTKFGDIPEFTPIIEGLFVSAPRGK